MLKPHPKLGLKNSKSGDIICPEIVVENDETTWVVDHETTG